MNTTLKESVSHWLAASISLILPWRATLSSCTSGGGARVNAERACSVSKSHGSRVQSILNIAAVARLGFAPIILDDHRSPRSWKATLRKSKNSRRTTWRICVFVECLSSNVIAESCKSNSHRFTYVKIGKNNGRKLTHVTLQFQSECLAFTSR